MDEKTSRLIRRAALRGFLAGVAVAVLLATLIALVFAAKMGEFRQGAVWGFGIGLGIMLGGTILNLVIGLLDQFKSDVTGT